ncbi:protein FAM177A1-like [Cydia strobilella]|uniref:protein FAM177A1-like n=1 Tax=Cydia strobilella TaxID=1100964 RepID=UPI003007BCC6
MESKHEVPSDQSDICINRRVKLLHFSDGVEEVIEQQNVSELDAAPKHEETVAPKSLDWGPWFSHYAWKSSTKVLNAVDYAGESLANFFGITTPKYQIEIEEHERVVEEQRKMEEDSVGWVPRNGGGDVPLVLTEPIKEVEKPAEV